MPLDAPAAAAPALLEPLPCRSLDDLALRAQRKEPGADVKFVEALFAHLAPIVRHRVMSMASGSLVPADADDMVQEIVLLMWQKDMPAFDPRRAGFLTFVNRRIRWHLSDRARKARREAGEEVDEAAVSSVIDEGRDPESLLDADARERTTSQIERHIEAADTDERARTVLIRCELEGATLAEVARELNMHVSNACRARRRGLRHMARYLEALV